MRPTTTREDRRLSRAGFAVRGLSAYPRVFHKGEGAALSFQRRSSAALLKLVLRQFGDLAAHPQKEFMNPEPAFGRKGIHLGGFGVVEMG